MSRFTNPATGVVFSVDDSKDERYTSAGYEVAPAEGTKRAPAKKATPTK